MDADESEATQSRARSYDTLNTLYHETRQELQLLNQQLHAKDGIICDLKARLARYERTYMTVGDNEPVVLGPSMSLLESLCKEICKHKHERDEMEQKATRQQEEIQTLASALQEKDKELQRLRGEPGHEKDAELDRLRSALLQTERSEATRAVLCTSLAEEAEQLRGQLSATVRVCKELLERLEAQGAEENRGKEAEEAQGEEKLDATKVMERLQRENLQLKQRVAYVQRLNSQWQKYDSSREEYIRGLCQRLKEGPSSCPVPASSSMLHQEIARLNGLLEDKLRESARLSRDLEDAKRHGRERVQMLEQQVLIYEEDFKSERRDRERAQGKLQEMKEQVRQLKQQLHKQGAAARDSDRDLVPLCRVHIGHRIAPRRTKDSEHLARNGPDRKQQQQQPPPRAAITQSSAWSDRADQSELRCPRCQARFSDTQAAQYLEHWEECARL
uniref:CCHC NOA-type domain-containing protein n=1 Tax=Knipowitschia caucasica TaxID=637954 RepID=A0AAV2LMU8_KNICA